MRSTASFGWNSSFKSLLQDQIDKIKLILQKSIQENIKNQNQSGTEIGKICVIGEMEYYCDSLLLEAKGILIFKAYQYHSVSNASVNMLAVLAGQFKN